MILNLTYIDFDLTIIFKFRLYTSKIVHDYMAVVFTKIYQKTRFEGCQSSYLNHVNKFMKMTNGNKPPPWK